VKEAGYSCGEDNEFAGQIGQNVIAKSYIKQEIDNRMRKSEKKSIADRQEIMEFWSRMMRGEILDQFDMPTTNADKLKAAQELAKRNIDIEDRIRERSSAQATAPEIRIKLDWGGGNDE
jgi:phage terminase small subunit